MPAEASPLEVWTMLKAASIIVCAGLLILGISSAANAALTVGGLS
jgi:hypothetical protein